MTAAPASTRTATEELRATLSQLRRRFAPAENANPALLVLTRVLGLFGLLALWLIFFGLALSSLVYTHAQSQLYATFRAELANGVAPIAGPIAAGEPVALLSVPAAGIDGVVVVEGSSAGDLRDGPGHLPGSRLPGQAGASVLLGRSASFGAPFGHLSELGRGDRITVTTGQGQFVYTVTRLRHPGDALPAPLTSGGSQLTLVTGEGSGWRSGWTASRALYVDATLTGTAAPATRASGIPSESDTILARDTSGLYPLVLWLQLLLLAAVAGVWMRNRWGAPRAWLLAGPVGLAGLWGASLTGWLLLPNLM